MKSFFSSLALFLALAACQSLDPAEPLPVYLDLREARVALDEDGTRSTRLGPKDYWINSGTELLGVFRQPGVIPYLPQEGVDSLVLQGGIFDNGLSPERRPYPFWRPVTVSLAGVEPLDTLRIEPLYRYFPRDTVLAYPFETGFEGAAIGFRPLVATNQDAVLTRSTQTVFEGSFSGRVNFDTDRFLFEVVSDQAFSLPQRGNNRIYIELTYQNDISFTAGLLYNFAGVTEVLSPGVFFRSTGEWNTVFVNLNDLVRGVPDGALFRLWIQASSRQPNSGQGREGYLLLDRVRVVHFR